MEQNNVTNVLKSEKDSSKAAGKSQQLLKTMSTISDKITTLCCHNREGGRRILGSGEPLTIVALECKTANSVDLSEAEHLSDTAGQEEPRVLSPRAHLSEAAEAWFKGSQLLLEWATALGVTHGSF